MKYFNEGAINGVLLTLNIMIRIWKISTNATIRPIYANGKKHGWKIF
jgi:hypothetical protein